MLHSDKHIFKFDEQKLKDVDKSLYYLLQIAYELKLISAEIFHHATTCGTNLLYSLEDTE